MGPILIFDKSTLESLNPDEAMWLDNFLSVNIAPLFYIETLADLEKQVRSGRTPESVVGGLAYKTPDGGSKCNAYDTALLAGELSGARQSIWSTEDHTYMVDGRCSLVAEPVSSSSSHLRRRVSALAAR